METSQQQQLSLVSTEDLSSNEALTYMAGYLERLNSKVGVRN
jgi:hypothetical protein